VRACSIARVSAADNCGSAAGSLRSQSSSIISRAAVRKARHPDHDLPQD
jgi:hypothetical protein